MSVAFEAGLLVVFLAILVLAANVAVEAISRFSKITGIDELSSGLVIVAISTSIPEVVVAVFSATSGNMGITLGDVFGSNVTNLALIGAFLLLLSPVRRIGDRGTSVALSRQLLLASAVPFLLLVVRVGTWGVGVALLGAFAYFVYHNLGKDRLREREKVTGSATRQLAIFLLTVVVVVVSARIVVESASSIAYATGLRESVIGASIVALGTSLPELSVDIVAVRKGHLGLAVGDIIGSCVTNSTLVLGVALSLSPVTTDFRILGELVSFAAGVPLLMFLILRRGVVSRWHGFVLLAVYAVFLAVMYGTQYTLG